MMKFSVAALLGLASCAQQVLATDWTVLVGGSSAAPDDQGAPGWYFSRFYPVKLTIRPGDNVVYRWSGTGNMPHSVTFSANGAASGPFTTTGAYSALAFNVPASTNSATLPAPTGYTPVSSGLRKFTDPDYTVTFQSAGDYNYYCVLHGSMSGIISVSSSATVGDGAGHTTPESVLTYGFDTMTADDTATKAYTTAQNLNSAEAAQYIKSSDNIHNTYRVYAGRGMMNNDQYMTSPRFYPYGLTVSVGDSVTFDASFDPFEAHTVAFNGAGTTLSSSVSGSFPAYDVVVSASEVRPNPVYVTPSSVSTGSGYSGSGVVASGLISAIPLTPAGVISSWTIKFATPGTYPFLCSLHADVGMSGFVRVLGLSVPVYPQVSQFTTAPASPPAFQQAATASTSGTPTGTTWTVLVGGSSAVSDYVGSPAWHFNKFYPASLTIRPGDSVRFRFSSSGFMPHTVSFSGSSIHSTVNAATGAYDALATNTPAGDYQTVAFTASVVSSGLRVTNSRDYVVSFPQANTFSYYCLLHSATMVGAITVSASAQLGNGNAAQTTPATVLAAAYASITADVTEATNYATAQGLYSYTGAVTASGNGKNTYTVKAGQGFMLSGASGYATASRFFPPVLSIEIGDTLKFDAAADAFEAHTVAFAQRDFYPTFPAPDVVTNGNFGPNAVYITRTVSSNYVGAPSTNTNLVPTASGFLSTVQLGPSAPTTQYTIAFAQPGIYKYMCSLHKDIGMWGYVEVRPAGTNPDTSNGPVVTAMGSKNGASATRPTTGLTALSAIRLYQNSLFDGSTVSVSPSLPTPPNTVTSGSYVITLPTAVTAVLFQFTFNQYTAQVQYRWSPSYPNLVRLLPASSLSSISYTCDPCSGGTADSCGTGTGPGSAGTSSNGWACAGLQRTYLFSGLTQGTNSFSVQVFDNNNSPAPLTSSYSFSIVRSSSVHGDPVIYGLQGQEFQVHGIPDEIFNLVSHAKLSVNARFAYLDDAACPDNYTACFAHPGTYINEVGVRLGRDKLRIIAGSASQGLVVAVNGKKLNMLTQSTAALKLGSVAVVNRRRVQLTVPGLLQLTLTNSDKFLNQEATLLDGRLLEQGARPRRVTHAHAHTHASSHDEHTASKSVSHDNDTESIGVKPVLHGLQGQTWQNVAYDDAEGGSTGLDYEGSILDYHIESGDLFGTDFTFNLFEY